MTLSGIRCDCGEADLIALAPGQEAVTAELRPWAGTPEISRRVGKRGTVRIMLSRSAPDRAWCAKCWPARPKELAA